MRELVKVDGSLSRQFATMSFVCAILIVALHSFAAYGACPAVRWIYTLVSDGLCSAAIPWFFFAAGFFLSGHIGEDGWWAREVLKRVRTLLVPFWIWGSVIFVFHIVFALIIHWVGYSYGGEDALTWISWKGLGRLLGFYPFNDMPTMWFMRTLFVFVVFSPLIAQMRLWGVGLFGVFYILHTLVPPFNWAVWNLGGCLFSLRGLTYFAAGIYLRKNPIAIRCRWPFWVIGIVLLIVRASFVKGLIGKSLELVLIPFVLVMLFDWCRHIKIPARVTALSFPIYLVHMMIVFCISALYSVTGLARSTETGFALGLLRTVLSVGASIALVRLLQKWCPRFASLAFGGRGK